MLVRVIRRFGVWLRTARFRKFLSARNDCQNLHSTIALFGRSVWIEQRRIVCSKYGAKMHERGENCFVFLDANRQLASMDRNEDKTGREICFMNSHCQTPQIGVDCT